MAIFGKNINSQSILYPQDGLISETDNFTVSFYNLFNTFNIPNGPRNAVPAYTYD